MIINYYEILGLENSVNNPLILMIHGAGGDSQHFKTVTPILVEQGYRVLLMDVRYHGRSQLQKDIDPEKITWTFDHILHDIDTMLDSIKEKYYQGVCKIHLFVAGLSMGGMITLLYAERLSNVKKEGIELAGIIPIASGIPRLEISRLGWDMYAQRRATQQDLERTKEAIIHSSITPYGQAQTKRAMQLISNKALYECLVAIATMLPNPSSPPASYKFVTESPILLIISEQDVLTRPEMDLLYQLGIEQRKKISRIYIRDAGHMVILDQGHQVGKCISAFCKKNI